jgi:CRISPR-associated exonuclease Cas4
MRIPVEQKPSALRVWRSHLLQVSAQCMLLEETSGVRPTHGVLVLANAQQQQVPFTADLEDDLVQTMTRMRRVLGLNEAPGPCWSRGKCTSCGFRQVCWGMDDFRSGAAGCIGKSEEAIHGHDFTGTSTTELRRQ